MPRETLTGSRIRQQRLTSGQRQADLARAVGISAAYLNLIEHNKRNIGGKLLVDIAGQLDVDVSALSEGAAVALIERLHQAASRSGGEEFGPGRAEDFASRFPQWAKLIDEQSTQLQRLEQTVEVLSDRLARDPNLSASLHEVLSTVTAIRSTASILAGADEIDPEWQARFVRNLREDSGRLADGAEALVAFLDDSGEKAPQRILPEEEVDRFFLAHRYHFEGLEDASANINVLIEGAAELISEDGRGMARARLEAYETLARQLPLAVVVPAVKRYGIDPGALASALGCSIAQILERLASLPETSLPGPLGFVKCDAAGAIIHRKTVPGFELPRFGAGCAKWPLFSALSQPMVPLAHLVEMPGRPLQSFQTYCIAKPSERVGFNQPARFEAMMLIVPQNADPGGAAPVEVGVNCRVCTRKSCTARREPSILSDGF